MNATGDLAGQPLKLSLDGGSLAALRVAGKPFPIDARLQVGDSTQSLSGQTDGLVQPSELSMNLAARLVQPLPLAETFGFDRPLPSPLELAAQLDYAQPQWRLSGLSIRYDESRVEGAITVDTGAIIRGSRAGWTHPRWTCAAVIASDATSTSSDSAPLDVKQRLAPLEDLEAELKLRADRLLGPGGLELNRLAVDVQVQDARLRVAPISLALGGGEASASLQLDAAVPDRGGDAATLQVDLERVGVREAAQQLGLGIKAPGTLNGTLDLSLKRLPDRLTLDAALPELRIDEGPADRRAPRALP